MTFAKGGLIPGEPMPITIKRLGVGPDGHCLYSLNGGPPERIITADEARKIARKIARVSTLLASLNKPKSVD